MKRLVAALFALLIMVTMEAAFAQTTPYPDIPRVSKEELKAMLGNPDVIILDVRYADEWQKSEDKIPGAVYENPGQIERWASKYPVDKKFVFY